VLPDDGGAERLAGPFVPEDDGLALVGDADGDDLLRAAGLLHAGTGAMEGEAPDLVRVMLDPAGAGIFLLQLLLDDADAFARRGEQHGAGRSGAFVEVEDEA